MVEDDTLIFRAQSGDEQAFVDLMRAYHAFVYAIVIGMVNNSHDAEDIVQEVFINTYRRLSQLEDTTKFKSWLAEVSRNCARNWQRTQRTDTVSINDVSEGTLQAADSPGEKLVRDEELEMIRRAMNTLSQKDRDIARSYYLDGASYDDLIRAHGLSYKAISFRLSRAKRTLAKRLQYLLSVAFFPPVISLKKISSGGLTAMKIGTIPKITVGVIAIIALAFIGSRQLLSPKEDFSLSSTVTVPKSSTPELTSAEVDTSLGSTATVPRRADAPQISAEEMGQIEDFFAQFDEADVQSDSRQPAETEYREDADDHVTGNTEVLTENTEQSAEEVMNAFLEAFRNLDTDTMSALVTEDMRGQVASVINIGGVEITKVSADSASDVPAEVVEDMVEEAHASLEEIMLPLIRKMINQAEVVSSGYVGDEYHFQFGMPAPEIPEHVLGIELDSNMTAPPDILAKMRRENGAWRIYDGETLD